MDYESLQRDFYNKNNALYEAHCYDKWSQRYRARFWYRDLFKGLDLRGKEVLEAMCGRGQAITFLNPMGAKVTGLDISDIAMDSFKKHWPKAKAVRASILNSRLKGSLYDCIVSIAGLHHLHPHLYRGLDEIHRLLKPRGYFCFIEPHQDSLADVVRKIWYRHDDLFIKNEASINLSKIKKRYSGRFRFNTETYGGNIAYIFVANSMILRIPVSLKSIYSPIVMPLESIFTPLQAKLTSCYVISQWQKIK